MTAEEVAWSYVESCPTCGTVVDIHYGCEEGRSRQVSRQNGEILAQEAISVCRDVSCSARVSHLGNSGVTESAEDVDKYVLGGADNTIPLDEQQRHLELVIARGPECVCQWIDDNWPVITQMARRRLREGFDVFGDTMYRWPRETRYWNECEEGADLLNYISSEPD